MPLLERFPAVWLLSTFPAFTTRPPKGPGETPRVSPACPQPVQYYRGTSRSQAPANEQHGRSLGLRHPEGEMEQDIGCCVHSAAPIPPRSQLSCWACTSGAQAGSGVGKARAGARSPLAAGDEGDWWAPGGDAQYVLCSLCGHSVPVHQPIGNCAPTLGSFPCAPREGCVCL